MRYEVEGCTVFEDTNPPVLRVAMDEAAARTIVDVLGQQNAMFRHDPAGGGLYVRWTDENVEQLAALGLPSVSPVSGEAYKHTPIRAKDGDHPPRDFQHKGIDFLVRHPKCFLFGDMGTGKTAMSIWAAEYLLAKGLIKSVLILTTASNALGTWATDHLPNMSKHKVLAVMGTAAQRRKKCMERGVYYVMNYEGVKTVFDELRTHTFDLVILDESTKVKTTSADVFKLVYPFVASASRVWALTGTPTPQSPMDAHGQGMMVCPHKMPHRVTEWRSMVMFNVRDFIWKPKSNSDEIVREVLQPALWISKDEVMASRPSTQIDWVQVGIEASQLALLKQLKERVPQDDLITKGSKARTFTLAGGGEITGVHAAALHSKYLQVLSGAVYTSDVDEDGESTGAYEVVGAKSRLDAVAKCIEEAAWDGLGTPTNPKGKVIVMVPFRHSVELVSKHLIDLGYDVAVIQGGTTMARRKQIAETFQKTQYHRVLVAQAQSVAHGLTLTAANTIVWYSPAISSETFQQANERCDRIGQTQQMRQVRLFATDIEKRSYNAILERQGWQAKLLSMCKDILRGLYD